MSAVGMLEPLLAQRHKCTLVLGRLLLPLKWRWIQCRTASLPVLALLRNGPQVSCYLDCNPLLSRFPYKGTSLKGEPGGWLASPRSLPSSSNKEGKNPSYFNQPLVRLQLVQLFLNVLLALFQTVLLFHQHLLQEKGQEEQRLLQSFLKKTHTQQTTGICIKRLQQLQEMPQVSGKHLCIGSHFHTHFKNACNKMAREMLQSYGQSGTRLGKTDREGAAALEVTCALFLALLLL